MEYVRGGTISKLFGKSVDKNFKRELIKNILMGVNWMHEKNYIHRDLKPENVLLVERGKLSPEVKLCDFGLAAYKGLLDDESLEEKFGTLTYMAPEQAQQRSYSKKVDIWAVGVLFYQLMNKGKHPIF